MSTEEKPNGVTGKEMCERIARYLWESQGVKIDPETIWNASPTGELWHVFALHAKAKAYFASKEEA